MKYKFMQNYGFYNYGDKIKEDQMGEGVIIELLKRHVIKKIKPKKKIFGRKPGRPKGSKNKPKPGRPKGSKNKPKPKPKNKMIESNNVIFKSEKDIEYGKYGEF